MKPLLILITFYSCVSYSQITVTNSTFPKAGDVLKTVSTSNPSSPVNVGNVNGPQTWDFSQLNSGSRTNTECKAPQTSPDFVGFPTADLLIVEEGGQDQFMDVTPNKISLLGFGGANEFLPIPVRVSFSQMPTYRRAPISFIQSSTSSGKFNIELDGDIIPDTLTMGIAVDSIRIQFSSEEKGVVDAYGVVKMQGKNTDVLREKLEVITETKLFVKLPFVGWIDPSSLLGGSGLGEFIGKDTSFVYNFYSATNKEILVSAEFDVENTFNFVTFADIGGIISSTSDQKLIVQSMTVNPNPVSEMINLDVNDIKSDQYILTISDASGKVVKADFENIQTNWSKQLDVSGLQNGLYLIQMINKSRTQSYTAKFLKL